MKIKGSNWIIVVRGFDGLSISGDVDFNKLPSFDYVSGDLRDRDGISFHEIGDSFEQRHLPGIEAQVRDFLRFIEDGKSPVASLEDAIKARQEEVVMRGIIA